LTFQLTRSQRLFLLGSFFGLSDFASGGLLADVMGFNDNVLTIGNIGVGSPGFVDGINFQFGTAGVDQTRMYFGPLGDFTGSSYIKTGRYIASNATPSRLATWDSSSPAVLTNSSFSEADLTAMNTALVFQTNWANAVSNLVNSKQIGTAAITNLSGTLAATNIVSGGGPFTSQPKIWNRIL
jgi:hypothetical protein